MKQLKINDKETILDVVTKINPKDKDIIIFSIKVDDQGYPVCALDYLQSFFSIIGKFLNDKIDYMILPSSIEILSADEAKKQILKLNKIFGNFVKEEKEKRVDE